MIINCSDVFLNDDFLYCIGTILICSYGIWPDYYRYRTKEFLKGMKKSVAQIKLRLFDNTGCSLPHWMV